MDRRTLNDDRRRRFGEPGRTLALLCECGDDDCHETVLATVEEVDARRPDALVHPVHGARPAGGADTDLPDSPLQ